MGFILTKRNQAAGRRLGRLLGNVPFWIGSAALFSLMCMTFADVILRSLFNSPIAAAAELTEISVAIVVFTALPLVSFNRSQIAVDLFDSYYSSKAARWRDCIIDIACGGLLYWPIVRILVLAKRASRHGSQTEFLEIPDHYIAYFVCVMLSVTALILIIRGIIGLAGYIQNQPTHSDHSGENL